MKLYIANGTRQTFNLQYRVPGVAGVRSQFIPSGKQLLVSGDLTLQEINYIIETNAKYGLTDCTKIDQSKPFVGLVYSIDKPVPSPRLGDVFDHNADVLVQRGHENRERAALVANNQLEGELAQSGIGGLDALDVEIVEEMGPNSDGNQIREGFRITRHETNEARVETGGKGGKGGRGGRRGTRKS